MMHWKKSMVFSGSHVHHPVDAVMFLLGALIQNTRARRKTSDQTFRQERPVVSRLREYELALALLWHFCGIDVLFLTTAVHCLNQRPAFSNKMSFPNTPASSFRLIPREWLFPLPRQGRAQAAHSPAPSWPHLISCALGTSVEKICSLQIACCQYKG